MQNCTRCEKVTYDLGDGVLVLFTKTNCLLHRDFVERVHAKLDILVDTLTVGCDADLDGCTSSSTKPESKRDYPTIQKDAVMAWKKAYHNRWSS